ncbi:WD domain, G-beta repeat protein [Dictyocaulus viviparus]|uniref:WD domain, G-beta repeat protein n=1 Tax=Dictyocaulus viviparus TaxID=29172 RepID=A0A0D8XAF1_DICVI|nr:WD domain, G-beta repeat protein [Dictyocaulus viviparus]
MFGLDLESRCLSNVPAEEDMVQLLVGTHNIKMDNQICRLSIDEEYSRISSVSFLHPAGEVRGLAASPSNANIALSVVANFHGCPAIYGAYLWEMDGSKGVLQLKDSVIFNDCPLRYVCNFEWEQHSGRGSCLFHSSAVIFQCEEGLKEIYQNPIPNSKTYAQAWNPHGAGNLLGLTIDKDIVCHDLRTVGECMRIKDAHIHRALHLDFNPNLQHVVASAGDEGAVRLWDWRHPTKSLMTINPHTHWAWQVRFHPVHDQLILTAGSDAAVVLSCIFSVSSEICDPDVDEVTGESFDKLEDGELERIEEHEESVYACMWASSDPWTFFSLSYDGRVVVSRVNRKHKYALMKL